MTVAEEAKAYGFKSLTEVAKLWGCSTEAIRKWHKAKLSNCKKHGRKFDIVLAGCKVYKEQQ